MHKSETPIQDFLKEPDNQDVVPVSIKEEIIDLCEEAKPSIIKQDNQIGEKSWLQKTGLKLVQLLRPKLQ